MTEHSARRLVRIAGTAVLVLAVVFQIVGPRRPVVANTPGFRDPVLGFELASRPEHVLGILGGPGDPQREDTVRRMNLVNRVDFLFMIAYPAFYVGIASLLAARGRLARRVASTVVVLAVLMAVFDALENRELLALAPMVDPAAMMPALGRLRPFTLVKWYALYLASGILAFGVWRDGTWWRWSTPFFGLAALVGLASVVRLPAIEWGMGPLAVAWITSWIHSLRWRSP